MANLYVLEGDGDSIYASPRNRMKIHRGNRRGRQAFARVPGIVEGREAELLGRSIWGKIKSATTSVAKVVAAPVTTTYSVAKSAGKATVNAVKNPSLTSISKIVTAPTTRLVNETKSNVKEAGHAAAEAGRAANTAASRTLDVTRRVAKRLIKSVAKKVLFKGDMLLGNGSVAAVPKNAAKGVLIPVATAAVVANTITAPAAPAVPALVNEVIDELYSAIEAKIKAGLSPDKAAAAARADLDKLEPGEENDPKVGSGYMLPLIIGGGLLAAILILKKK